MSEKLQWYDCTVNDRRQAVYLKGDADEYIASLQAELLVHKENEGNECPLCACEAEVERLLADIDRYDKSTFELAAKVDTLQAEVEEAYIRGALDYCRKESLVREDVDVPDDLLSKDGE